MTPTTCALCRHFRPDQVNPPAGIGDCAKGHGSHYPMAKHWCRYWEARPV